MYKLLLVDDEHYVVKGLRNIINWKSHNIKVAGEAYDGNEALEFLENEKVDIIFLDIKMPNISGMEVMEEIDRLGLDVSVVIMSGLDDFKFVRQCLRYNVFDYLLKPTKIDDIISTVERLVESLDKEKEQQQEENKDIIRYNLEDYLKQQIKGLDNIKPTNDMMKILDQKRYVLSIFEIDYSSVKEKNRTDNLFSNLYYMYRQDIYKSFNETLTCVISNDDYKCIVVFMLQFHQSYDKLLEKIADFSREFHYRINATSTVSISGVANDSNSLNNLYFQAKQGMKSKVYSGNGQLVIYDASKQKIYDNQFNPVMEAVDLSTITGLLSNEQVSRFIVKLEEKLRCNKMGDINFVRSLYKKVLERIMRQIYNRGQSDIASEVGIFEKLSRPIQQFETITDISSYVETVLLESLSKSNREKKYKNPREIKYMVNYIHENYWKNLNLDFFAKELGLTNNYLSYIFRQDVGKTFGQYVMEFRVEKAKQLLTETNLRIYEISNKVGYRNPHYFSKIFKKYTGVEPSNYKKLENVI